MLKSIYNWDKVAKKTKLVYQRALKKTDMSFITRIKKIFTVGHMSPIIYLCAVLLDFLFLFLFKMAFDKVVVSWIFLTTVYKPQLVLRQASNLVHTFAITIDAVALNKLFVLSLDISESVKVALKAFKTLKGVFQTQKSGLGLLDTLLTEIQRTSIMGTQNEEANNRTYN